VSAGSSTRKLVSDYEELLRRRPDAPKLEKSWSGDVWAFAEWAKKNLKGFDPHRTSVGFLPGVAAAAIP